MELREDVIVKFVRWLPEIHEGQGYLLQLMTRGKELRAMGVRIRDKPLKQVLVHGYLDTIDERYGWRYWRTRLIHEIKNLALLMEHGYFEVEVKDEKGRITGYIAVPREARALTIMVNPSNVIRAASNTAKRIIEQLAEMSEGKSFREAFKRPDKLYWAEAAAHRNTIYHSIDVDSIYLIPILYRLARDRLKTPPAVITTVNGVHLLVRVDDPGHARYHVRREIMRDANAFSSCKHTFLDDKAKCNRLLRNILEKLLDDRDSGLFYVATVLSKLSESAAGRRLVDVNKQALEPIPGVRYRTVIPEFAAGDDGWHLLERFFEKMTGTSIREVDAVEAAANVIREHLIRG